MNTSRPRGSTARAAALLQGRGAAAVGDQHRGAVRHPVHLWLEPVPVAAADGHRPLARNHRRRPHQDDRQWRCAERVEPHHGNRGARPAAAGRRGGADAALVHPGPDRDGEVAAWPASTSRA